jgi:hypothetical protein
MPTTVQWGTPEESHCTCGGHRKCQVGAPNSVRRPVRRQLEVMQLVACLMDVLLGPYLYYFSRQVVIHYVCTVNRYMLLIYEGLNSN